MSAAALRLPGFRTPGGRAAYLAAYDEAMELWPVPYRSSMFATRFGPTHVVTSGPEGAPPIVLLHAATGAGAVQWFPNATRLSAQHRIHAVDFIGAPGGGTQQRAIVTPEDCALWLDDLFDSLGLERAALVGSSHGGWLALNFAMRSARRLSRLVLLAPAAGVLSFRLPVWLSIRVGPYLPAWTARPALRANFGGRYEPDPRFVALMERALEHFRYQQRAVFPSVFSDEELRAISSPTLLLIGEEELIYRAPKALRRASALMPSVEAELVPGAGHLLNMEQPERIDARILAFLGRPASAGPRPPGGLCTSTTPASLAEREGFEPSEALRPQRFSRPPRSTAPASLRRRG